MAPPLAALLDQLGQVYVLLDREGTIVDVNEAFLALTGYARKQVLGQRSYELLTPPAERDQRSTRLPRIALPNETLPAATSARC